VGADEAFNPNDVRMLHPDAVVLTRMSGRGPEAEGIQGQYNALGSVVGPIFEDESVDSGTVYGSQT
jgi:hypothetical protein